MRIPDVVMVEPVRRGDERGFFTEFYSRREFAAQGIEAEFVQDNHSGSSLGVVRGLHYQVEPMAQGKLVRVLAGEIFDVVVDIRPRSPTFGQWIGEYLSAENRRMLYIPAGFAHGFCAVRDGTEVLYKATAFYSPAHEKSIRWDDPALGIRWPQLAVPY